MPISPTDLRHSVRALRRIVDRLERQLEPEVNEYARRREVLGRIYQSGNNMAKQQLMGILKSHGTNYAWIGQQVKRGYLEVRRTPGEDPDNPHYSVTPTGVREQRLDEEDREETAAWSRASEAAFAEDWDQEEDALYDDV